MKTHLLCEDFMIVAEPIRHTWGNDTSHCSGEGQRRDASPEHGHDAPDLRLDIEQAPLEQAPLRLPFGANRLGHTNSFHHFALN
jgi:hypothetical protein